MSILKSLAAYQLVRLLSSKFSKWDAYKLGLIDDEGETIRKPKTDTEKKSFTVFHRLVRRIKQIMSKAPFGVFKIASLAIALKLLKEDTNVDLTSELEEFGLNNSVINEHYSHYTPNEVICKGKYTDNNGNIFIVKSDILPIDNIISVNVYEVNEVVTKKRILVTTQTINKL